VSGGCVVREGEGGGRMGVQGCTGVRAQGPALVSIRDSAPAIFEAVGRLGKSGPGASRVPYQQGVAADLQKQAPDAVDS
jgi:hypothetical protein